VASITACASGLPCSSVRSLAISGTAAFTFTAAACMSAARFDPDSEAHAGSAFAAASTAASTSAGEPLGIVSTTSPFAGLRTSIVFPVWAATVWPSMSIVAIREIPPCAGQNTRARRARYVVRRKV